MGIGPLQPHPTAMPAQLAADIEPHAGAPDGPGDFGDRLVG
jgi:hypothetical protein